MNCREATVFISLHVGDDLPAEQVPALEEHLEHCRLCEAEFESYASARDALLGLREDFLALPGQAGVPGPSLWESLQSELPGAQAAAVGGSTRRWWRHPLLRQGLAAGFLALLSSPLWFNWSGSEPTAAGAETLRDFRPILAGVDLSDMAEDRGLEGQPLQEMQHQAATSTQSVSPEELQRFLQLNQSSGLLMGSRKLDPATIAVPVNNPNRGSY